MRRILLAALAVLVLLPLLALAAAAPLLNTAPARARILDAVQRATGHPARIDGPIGIAWSLAPTLSVQGLALANPPGYTRPDFVTARRIDARLALLPLLSGRIQVDDLWIAGPDALLERDAAGRGNWLPAPTPASPAPATPATPRTKTPVQVARLHITDGHVAGLGLPPIMVPSLEAAPPGGPLAATALLNGIPIQILGAIGPHTPEGPTIDLTAVAQGLALAASGSLSSTQAQPIAFTLKSADLAAAAPLLGRPLPPLHDLELKGQWSPAGPADLTLTAGAADLTNLVPGLALTTLRATMAAPGQPIHAQATARLGALPIAAAAALAAAPATLQLELTADSATLAVQANLPALPNPAALDAAWSDATIALAIPNLARTGALAGIRLPGLRDATIAARLLPAPGGGILVRALRLASAQGDIAGDLAVALSPRPSLRGSLVSQHLDLDAWTKQPKPAKPPTSATSPAATSAPATTPAAATPPAPHTLVPDRPLPLSRLRALDLDLRWAVASIASRGVAYRSVLAHAVLQGGRLRLDPIAAILPGGPLQALATLDAAASPPTAALALRAPTLDAAALAAAAGHPGALSGTLDLDLALHAAGDTPHALAATLAGHAALALTDGEIDNALVAQAFGPALQGASIPVDAAGRSRLRCLAFRLDLTDGQATLAALGLDTTKLQLAGQGALDLAAETMDLHLRPTIRLGPTSVAVPVHLAGPWRAPKAAADKGVLAPGRFGLSIGAPTPDPCTPALAAVHAP